MPITEELRGKIDRIFDDKRSLLMEEECDRVALVEEIERARILAELEGFDNIAKKLSRRAYTEQKRALSAEFDAKKDALALEKENMLINLSYAEDVEELKAIFAQAGLVW